MQKAHQNINWENKPSIETPINETNLNLMDRSIDEIDNRVIAMDTSKADQVDLLQACRAPTYDSSTGTLSFPLFNGTTVTINTNLEKMPVNFVYDSDPTSAHYQSLILTLDDGTVEYIDLSALLTQYEFSNSSTISFTVGNTGSITANIIDGSITDSKIQPNYLADITVQASRAESSETGANASALVSEGWARGTQNGIAVTSQSPYYHNNAEWYKDQAQQIAAGTLAGLNDVTIDSPTQGQTLLYDEQSQEWYNGESSAGILPKLHIVTESNSSVTVTKGTDTYSPTLIEVGVYELDAPEYGTYTVRATNTIGTQTVNVVVDACKIYNVTAYHFNATITVTFPVGSVCTLTHNGVSRTADTNPMAFGVNEVGTYTIAIAEDGQTVSQNVTITTDGQTESLTLDFAYIALTIPSELIGQTVTITDGTSTRTWVSSATTHTFVCILGNYTLSIGGYSTSVNVVAYTTYTASIETWGYKGWLASASIADTFGSLDALIADQPTIRTLMTKHVSCDYLYNWYTHDSSILSTILSNTNTVKWFGLRDYVCDKFMANPTAKTAILASTNWAYILKDKVPIMTSASAPYGEPISNSTYSGYPTWRAFDNDTSTLWGSGVTGTTPNTYCGYKFVNPICVRKVKILPRQDSYSTNSPKNYTVDASNDGSNWTTLLTVTDASAPSSANEFIENDLNNDNYYLYYRVNTTQTQAGADRLGFSELQFYGRALNVSVPVMTSATTPFGVAISDGNYSGYDPYLAFDSETSGSTYWNYDVSSSHWLGYKFTSAVICKSMFVRARSTHADMLFKDYKIQGSNDGTNWTDITESLELTQTAEQYVSFNNDNAYQYYRIYMTTYRNSGQVAVATLQFYGIDYSEHTERHWIYDNGVEVESVEAVTDGGGTGTSVVKGNDSIMITDTSTSLAIQLATTSSVDLTDYDLFRIVIGDTAVNLTNITQFIVDSKTIGSQNVLAQASLTASNSPNNNALDISSVNQSAYPIIGVIRANTGTIEVKELWLE